MKKKTSGRKKIEIKKITKITSQRVTFTKRRTGLFKKASELCVLTGAEMVILVHSPGGRVFAFAHPNADSVINTYLGNNVSNSSPVSENLTCMYEEYGKEYEEIAQELEVEMNKSNNVEESCGFWWENSFENLEIDELENFINSMEQLKINVTKKADELRNSATSSSSEEIADANIVDGLLDDQVILPILDHFLPDNFGVSNENLMMPAVYYDSSGFENGDNFGVSNEDLMMSAVYYDCIGFENGELVLDNHDNEHNDCGNNLQVQSDFSTFGVPDDLYFGHDHVQSDFGVPDDLYFGHDHVQSDFGTFGVPDNLYFGHDQI